MFVPFDILSLFIVISLSVKVARSVMSESAAQQTANCPHRDGHSMSSRWATALILPSKSTDSVENLCPDLSFSSFDVVVGKEGRLCIADPRSQTIPRNLPQLTTGTGPETSDGDGPQLPTSPFHAILENPSFRRLLFEPYRTGTSTIVMLQHPETSCSTENPHEMLIGTPDAFGLLPLALKMLYEDPDIDGALGDGGASLPEDSTLSSCERAGRDNSFHGHHRGGGLMIQTSFVALTRNTILDLCKDLLPPAAAGEQGAIVPPLRLDLVESMGSGGLAGSTWRMTGEKRIMSHTLDDALETLDVGLDALAHAAETKIIRSESACTLVFNVYFHGPQSSSTLTIVGIGQDDALRKWLLESISESAEWSAHRVRAGTAAATSDAKTSGAPGGCSGVDSIGDVCHSRSFVPRPLHHHAATLIIPLLCRGNYLVGSIFRLPPSSPQTAMGPDVRQRWELVRKAANVASSLSTVASSCPPLQAEVLSSMRHQWASTRDDVQNDLEKDSTTASHAAGDSELLPEGWEAMITDDGRIYYVDHIHKCTTWDHPSSGGSSYEDDSVVASGICAAPSRSASKRQCITSSSCENDAQDLLFSIDHDQQCWGPAPSEEGVAVSTSAEVSLMIIDPDMRSPRVILSGSRDVSAVVESEIASAQATTPNRSCAQQLRAAETPAVVAQLFASPPAGGTSPSGEVINCGDMKLVLPLSAGEEPRAGCSSSSDCSSLADDVTQSISTTNFIEELSKRISGTPCGVNDDAAASSERAAAAAEEVRLYLVKPSSDEEKIESFLFELECILQTSIQSERQNRSLQEEIDRLQQELLVHRREPSDVGADGIMNLASLLERIEEISKDAVMPIGEDDLGEIGLTASSSSNGDVIVAAIENVVARLSQDNRRLRQRLKLFDEQRSMNRLFSSSECPIIGVLDDESPPQPATARGELLLTVEDQGGEEWSRNPIHLLQQQQSFPTGCITMEEHQLKLKELDATLYKKHVDIVGQLCDKQKDVIRKLYADFDAALQQERQRNKDLESLLAAAGGAPSSTGQHIKLKQNVSDSPGPLFEKVRASASSVDVSGLAMKTVQEPSPSLRRWSEEDDDEIALENDGSESALLLGAHAEEAEETTTDPSSSTVLSRFMDSFRETDSEHAMLVHKQRSSHALMDEQAQLLARIQRYRSRQLAESEEENARLAQSVSSNRSTRNGPDTSRVLIMPSLDAVAPRPSQRSVLSSAAARSNDKLRASTQSSPFTKPISAVELLQQRHASVQQLMNESASQPLLRRGLSTGAAPSSSTLQSKGSSASRGGYAYARNPPTRTVLQDSGLHASPSTALHHSQAVQRKRLVTDEDTAGDRTPANGNGGGLRCLPGGYRQAHSPKRLQSNGHGSNHALLRVPKTRSTSAGAHEVDPYAFYE